MSKYTISKLEDGCKQILKEIKKQKTYVNEVENENIYLQNDLDNANSKVSDLSNRILEAIELNGKILNMIDDGRSREQFLPYLKNQKKLLERGKE